MYLWGKTPLRWELGLPCAGIGVGPTDCPGRQLHAEGPMSPVFFQTALASCALCFLSLPGLVRLLLH